MLCGIPVYRFQIRKPVWIAAELTLLLHPLQTDPMSTSQHCILLVRQPTRGTAGIGGYSRSKTPWITMVSLPRPSLAKLYGLSDQIFDLSTGELPPIKAWAAIKQNPRFPFLHLHHFKQLRDELLPHVVCLR